MRSGLTFKKRPAPVARMTPPRVLLVLVTLATTLAPFAAPAGAVPATDLLTCEDGVITEGASLVTGTGTVADPFVARGLVLDVAAVVNRPLVRILNCDNFEVRDSDAYASVLANPVTTCVGPTAPNGSQYNPVAILVHDSENVRIENVTFAHAYDAGLKVTGESGVNVTGALFARNFGNGIWVDGPGYVDVFASSFDRNGYVNFIDPIPDHDNTPGEAPRPGIMGGVSVTSGGFVAEFGTDHEGDFIAVWIDKRTDVTTAATATQTSIDEGWGHAVFVDFVGRVDSPGWCWGGWPPKASIVPGPVRAQMAASAEPTPELPVCQSTDPDQILARGTVRYEDDPVSFVMYRGVFWGNNLGPRGVACVGSGGVVLESVDYRAWLPAHPPLSIAMRAARAVPVGWDAFAAAVSAAPT